MLQINIRTWRTSILFFTLLVKKRLRLRLRSVRLDQIFNYLKSDDQLSTFGHAFEDECELIRDADFQTVVNLAPHDGENSLRDEAGLLRNLSLDYVHIPVDLQTQ